MKNMMDVITEHLNQTTYIVPVHWNDSVHTWLFAAQYLHTTIDLLCMAITVNVTLIFGIAPYHYLVYICMYDTYRYQSHVQLYICLLHLTYYFTIILYICTHAFICSFPTLLCNCSTIFSLGVNKDMYYCIRQTLYSVIFLKPYSNEQIPRNK